uniref:Si:ch211-113j13.2 n=1 Tax=Petromyzon marinus TaxID=7757 RepID=S4RAK2_PETMA
AAAPMAGKYKRQRYVTKDGKCRVRLGHIQDKMRFLSDMFTTIVDLKYRWFLAIFTLCYLLTWLLFGLVYLLMALIRGDLDPQEGHQACFDNVDGFLGALLFSVETQRTIGYADGQEPGRPTDHRVLIAPNSDSAFRAAPLCGATACQRYKKYIKQKNSHLIFSFHLSRHFNCPVISIALPIHHINRLIIPHINRLIISSRGRQEGEFLPLEQSDINLGSETGRDSLFLVEPLLIYHVIDASSPFWEFSAESLQHEEFEIVVILQGTIEATGVWTCQALTSYTNDEILWGHRFEPVMSLVKGAFKVDYSCFENTYEVNLPTCSAKEMYEKQQAA